MNKIIAYTSIEQIVVGDYRFNCNEYNFFDNEVTAREDIEDFKEDNELTYVAKVEIINKLFNIYNPIHRRQLLSTLPVLVEINNKEIHREVLVLSLMGNINKDDYTLVSNEDDNSTFELFDNSQLKDIIKYLGFNGYVSMIDGLSQYTVFNPDKYVKILNLFL